MIKKLHPHAEIITEWIKDTSKKIEVSERGSKNFRHWKRTSISAVFNDGEGRLEFRLVSKPLIVSSLTDEELFAIAEANNPGQEDIDYTTIRAIADAAAERAIVELKLSEDWLDTNFPTPYASHLAKQVIEQYLTDLKEGKLAYPSGTFLSRMASYC
jgi:hypothetical protein